MPTIDVMWSLPLIATGLTLLLEAPAPPPAAARPVRVSEVPVLMYHVIADPPTGAEWPHLWVAPSELAAQLAWLDSNGYEAVTLSDVWRNWHGQTALPRRPVVLTFDDGYPSHATRALPLLAARGWPGVLHLKLGNVTERGGISAVQVRALVAAGWELGAHTLTHPDLRGLDDRALEHEVAGSRRAIERRFGTRVRFFCYPSGRYDARVLGAVRRAGYLGATTTEHGFATPERPFELKRIRISRGDGVRALATALRARSAASPDSVPRALGSDRSG
jgi:peptidoglycan/xylan/chitin deacetylase (PgdA/CDA1 family)